MAKITDPVWTDVHLTASIPWETVRDDGILIDYTGLANEHIAGPLPYPVLLTRALYDQWITVPKTLVGIQDEDGRAWDVFAILRSFLSSQFAKLRENGLGTIHVYFSTRRRGGKVVELTVHLAPGKTTPALIVSLPGE